MPPLGQKDQKDQKDQDLTLMKGLHGMMASNLHWDGHQPKSDGHQPKSDGLQPT